MTKQEIISEIEKAFKENPNMVVEVADMGFHNSRWNVQGKYLGWADNIVAKVSTDGAYWFIDLLKRKKDDLMEIRDRVCFGKGLKRELI